MLLGDASTAKTSLTIRYISGFYLEDLTLTIGVDFYSKTTYYREHKVKLQLWDFGGEERFRFLLHQYCKGANGAMLLYDITNPSTLSNLPQWIQIVREHAGDIPIMLVGVKLELASDRLITREEGIAIATHYGLSSFIELSARTGENVERAFNEMTEILFDRYLDNHGNNDNLNDLLEDEHPNPLDQKIFKVNDKLLLKFENNRTNIYVDGRLFQQCKYLLLSIPKEKIRNYYSIDSIDEAAERLDRSLEGRSSTYVIDPESEFWGHCSNIQAWYENDYDTRILHRNLAFPLLKALKDANDSLAKQVFKDEIAIRFESGYPSVVFYLIEEKFLNLLSEQEMNTILENPEFIKNLPKWFFNKNVPESLRKKIKAQLYKFVCPICITEVSRQSVDDFLARKPFRCQFCFTNFNE